MEPVIKTDLTYTPANYFCKYELDLDKNVQWQFDVWRMHSIVYLEDIEVVLHSSMDSSYNDDYLRSASYRYGTNNNTSHASKEIKKSVHSVTVYARNVLAIKDPTFKVQIKADTDPSSWVSSLITFGGTFLGAAICCCIM